MKIETKYNLNESVFFMYDNKIKSGRISTIKIEVVAVTGETEIEYSIFNYIGNKFKETKLFKTKYELLEYLKNN